MTCFSGDDTVTTQGDGMAKITKRAIDALKPRVKLYIEFDTDVKGFGCRVMPSGVKTYILEYRPRAGGRGTATKRFTFGRHGAMTAEQARDAALDALARIRLGEDPQREKSLSRASLTVCELTDAKITLARSSKQRRAFTTKGCWRKFALLTATSRPRR